MKTQQANTINLRKAGFGQPNMISTWCWQDNFKLPAFMLRTLFSAILLFFMAAAGWGQIAQRGTATSATTTTLSLTINKPSGVVAGDVMIVNITQSGNTETNASSSGWSLIAGAQQGSQIRRSTILYRIADGNEGSSFAFTLGAGTTHAIGSIIAFSGVSPSVLDVTGVFTTGGGTTATASSITTNTPGAAVIFFAGSWRVTYIGWTITNPTLTEIMDFP
jgi:hypothetical protein